MSIVIFEILLIVLGLAVLTVAADQLVLGSSRTAARLNVSPVIVGVVVIGLGTSAPEFLVSGLAAGRGDMGIAIGNIVGSNIINVTLILGVGALVAAVGVSSTVIRREVRLSAVSVMIFAVAAWIGLSPWTAALLSVALLGALWLLVVWTQQGRNGELADEATEFVEAEQVLDVPSGRWRSLPAVEPIRAAVGLLGVLVGAQLMVANASAIATRLGVEQTVIGLTLVALGTSMPELVTTVAAQRRGESDLVVGNLFGSNLFNSLAGGAVIGFAGGTAASVRPDAGLLGVMVLSSLLAWALLRRGLRLTRPEGAVLVGAYLISLPIVLSA